MIKLTLKIQPLFGPFFQPFLESFLHRFAQCFLFLFGRTTLLILVRVFQPIIFLFYQIKVFLRPIEDAVKLFRLWQHRYTRQGSRGNLGLGSARSRGGFGREDIPGFRLADIRGCFESELLFGFFF